MALKKSIKYDQHFCADGALIKEMVRAAQLQKEDIILEIGPGQGILTRELAKKVKKVMAVEIDQNLKPFLQDLPSKVEVVWMDIMKFLQLEKDKKFNKIVANIPYQICEPLLQYLCTASEIELAVLTVPKKFAERAQEHPFISAWLEFKKIRDVPPTSFLPPPKVWSALIVITRNNKQDKRTMLLRQLFLQRDKKLRNALRESLIMVYSQNNKTLTKKKAGQMIEDLHIPEKALESLVVGLPNKFYQELFMKIKSEN